MAERLTVTIVSVGPHGVTAARNWGNVNPDGTKFVHIHEGDSPGITKHRVGDTVAVAAKYSGPYTDTRLKEVSDG